MLRFTLARFSCSLWPALRRRCRPLQADTPGRVQAGYLVDLVAAKGDPMADIGPLYKASFVMTGGTVHRNMR